jgi:general stress protein 26
MSGNNTTAVDIGRLLAGASETIRKVSYCWLVADRGDGHATARPMGRLLHDPGEDEWTIRFVTDGRSSKVRDLQRDGRVSLIFQDDRDDAYAALAGKASLRTDAGEVRRRWKPHYDAYFPTDSDRANAIFLEVRIDGLDLWIRGVTPEPFGLKTTRLERDAGGSWRLASDLRAAA